MKALRTLLITGLLAVALVLPLAATVPAAAQGGSWLQVWYFPQNEYDPALIEYRDAAGTVLAAYDLATDSYYGPRQANGFVFGWDMESIPIFDPYRGQITHVVPPRLPESTDQVYYTLSNAIPGPDGTYAYAISQMDMQGQSPSVNRIYVSRPGLADHQMVYEVNGADGWMAVQPLGWSADGSTLLLHNMPQGIGGYILYWQWQDVRALNVPAQSITPLGSLDGYSDDLAFTATIAYDQSGPSGVNVTERATGQTQFYPLPPLPETVQTGGDVVFAPDNSYFAYQVARGNPEQEKFYTIAVNRLSGQAQVVLEDESFDYEVTFGYISGWLDNNTLVVGGPWTDMSAVIDVTLGAVVREEFGIFLGYAQGVSSVSGFVPSGTVYTQCPGAPVSRLAANMRGRITYTSGAMTNVRYWAGLSADLAGQMPEGATFTVLFGPTCLDGYAWWNLQFDSGLEGYVAEGIPGEYWLEPWQ